MQFGGQQFNTGVNGAGGYGVSRLCYCTPLLFQVSIDHECPLISMQVMVKAHMDPLAKVNHRENMVYNLLQMMSTSMFNFAHDIYLMYI